MVKLEATSTKFSVKIFRDVPGVLGRHNWQLCRRNSVSLYRCSAVEVACLTQNIRHSSASVRLRLVAFWCL